MYTYRYVYKRIETYKKRLCFLAWCTFASSIDRKIKFLFNPSGLLTKHTHSKTDTNILIMSTNTKNSVQIVGHVGKDVVLTSFENGNKKATTIVATNEFYTNKTGEKVKQTDWHKIIAWGKTAEDLALCFKKGTEVAIHGKLSNRTYTDTTGTTRYVTEIIVNEFYKIAKITQNTAEAVPF